MGESGELFLLDAQLIFRRASPLFAIDKEKIFFRHTDADYVFLFRRVGEADIDAIYAASDEHVRLPCAKQLPEAPQSTALDSQDFHRL